MNHFQERDDKEAGWSTRFPRDVCVVCVAVHSQVGVHKRLSHKRPKFGQ